MPSKTNSPKTFLLDTNILLSDPRCPLEGFEENNVVICGTVLQELDRKKDAPGEVGFKAREAIRVLDSIRQTGDITKGVRTKGGGTLTFEPDGVKAEYLPDGFNISKPDNMIISTCIHLNRLGKKNQIILVTNDVSMRVNATICGIKVQEYRNSIVETSGYKGWTDINVSAEVINKIYAEKSAELPKSKTEDLLENEFVTLHAGNQSALSVYRDGKVHLINDQRLFGWVRPKNALQSYAMYALTAPAEEIPLVILLGPAGSAKTFLSLAAGLDQTYTDQKKKNVKYNKVLLSRPTAESYNEVGFLPGDLEEKLSPLLASYYDNMEVLLSQNGKEEDREQVKMQMQDILNDGTVEVCGLSFIRGRSLMNSYIICDESQNASKTLIRDVITRAGLGTKVVICGDPDQIDVPTLDKRNNGLVYAAENMKGSKLAAVIQFDAGHSVRSPLAKEAIQKMPAAGHVNLD